MPIIIKKGDLFSTTQAIIAHGVNCSGGFGSGIAGQIARIFPEVRKAYLEQHGAEGWRLGQIQLVSLRNPGEHIKAVVNMATQQGYGRKPGVRYVDYEAVRHSFTCLLDFLGNYNSGNEEKIGIAMPRIGAGLGGGEWPEILSILSSCMAGRDVVVEVWSLN